MMLKCIEFTEKSTQFVSQNIVKQEDGVILFYIYSVYKWPNKEDIM